MLGTVNHLTLYTSTQYSTLSYYGQSIISHCIQVHSTPHFHIRDSQSSHTVYKYTVLPHFHIRDSQSSHTVYKYTVLPHFHVRDSQSSHTVYKYTVLPHFHVMDSQSSHTVYKYTVLHTFMLGTVNHLTLYTSTLYSTLSC